MPTRASVESLRTTLHMHTYIYMFLNEYIYMHVYTCTCMQLPYPRRLHLHRCTRNVFQRSKVISYFSRKGIVPSNERRCTCTRMYVHVSMHVHVHVLMLSVGCHNRLHPQHSPCGLGSCDLNIFIAAADSFSL